MSMPPGGPQWGGYQYQPPPPKKSPVPWIVAGVAAAVVAAVAVTLVLTLGGDEDKPSPSGGGNKGSTVQDRDLSSPGAAAESFAAAVKDGSPDEVLALTCVGDQGCVDKLAADPDNEVTPEKIDKAKEMIKGGVPKLAAQLDGAEFETARKASTPGAMEVPYRKPGDDVTHFMIFIESGGEWFYIGGGGGQSAPSAPPANRPSPAR